MDEALSHATNCGALRRSPGTAIALLCTLAAWVLVQGAPASNYRSDPVDSSRRDVALPTPIRFTGLAAGDAIAADDEAPDWRCRVVCAL